MFGGQIIGQAMVAASKTKPDGMSVHSMHCYFVRPGGRKLNKTKPFCPAITANKMLGCFPNPFFGVVSFTSRKLQEADYLPRG